MSETHNLALLPRQDYGTGSRPALDDLARQARDAHAAAGRAVNDAVRHATMMKMPCFEFDVPQRGDALELLRSLQTPCAAVVLFDPQHRGVLDHLKFGNEGARQRGRAKLPAMSDDYIDRVCLESARVLKPGGYLMRWVDTFGLCEGHHQRIAEAVKPVDLIAWDNLRLGMGKRTRRRGDYLLILQKPPISPRTWRDHGIPNRWPEKVDRKHHPHIKPIGLTTRLIGAVTEPGDLVVDPAAGSFVVLHAARQLERNFIGCDIAYAQDAAAFDPVERRDGIELEQLNLIFGPPAISHDAKQRNTT